MSKRPRLPLSYCRTPYKPLFPKVGRCGFSTFQFTAARACLELKGFCPHSTDDLPAPHSTDDLPSLGLIRSHPLNCGRTCTLLYYHFIRINLAACR